jgi:hypothetical protein
MSEPSIGQRWAITPRGREVERDIIQAIGEAFRELLGTRGSRFITSNPGVVRFVPKYNFPYYRRRYGARRIPTGVTPGTLRASGAFFKQSAFAVYIDWSRARSAKGEPYARHVYRKGITGRGRASLPGASLTWIQNKTLQRRVRTFVWNVIREKLIERLGRFRGLIHLPAAFAFLGGAT